MSSNRLGRLLGAVALFVSLHPAWAGAPIPAPDPDSMERGHHIYDRACVSCHGERGDGRGVSAPFLEPKPRDFTQGVYKWRSTPSGSLPLDSDLIRTVRNGVHNTNMPRWSVLTDQQATDVVAYIESFSPAFREQPRGKAIAIPIEPPLTSSSIEAGKKRYQEMGCAACHGTTGRGDGPSAATLVDDWGRPIRPFDFASGHLKSGDTDQDIYRVFMTGLNGTPMPSFAETLKPAQAWELVHYLRSLMTPEAERLSLDVAAVR